MLSMPVRHTALSKLWQASALQCVAADEVTVCCNLIDETV